MNIQEQHYIWDPVVRLTHWTMAILFLVNYFLLESGDTAHEIIGYVVAIALIVRIVWGFIGTGNAKFKQFFPTPSRLKHYLQHSDTRYSEVGGHNALGAVMIFTLLFLLLVISITGWLQETDRFWGEAWPQNLHEWSSYIAMLLVSIHITAVIWVQKRTGIPLIEPMVSGIRTLYKEVDDVNNH